MQRVVHGTDDGLQKEAHPRDARVRVRFEKVVLAGSGRDVVGRIQRHVHRHDVVAELVEPIDRVVVVFRFLVGARLIVAVVKDDESATAPRLRAIVRKQRRAMGGIGYWRDTACVQCVIHRGVELKRQRSIREVGRGLEN